MVGKRAGREAVIFSSLEKKTETCLALRIPAKTSEAVTGAMNTIQNEYGDRLSEVFKTITVDNGSEFSDFAQMDAWGAQAYFAHPYIFLGKKECPLSVFRFRIRSLTAAATSLTDSAYGSIRDQGLYWSTVCHGVSNLHLQFANK